MQLYITIICGLFMFKLSFGAPFFRIIGDTASFGATISIVNSDSTQNACDSLCSRYWFVKWNRWNSLQSYDYRITIIRKASIPGTITILSPDQYYPWVDPRPCDSLGFTSSQYNMRIVQTDTTIVHWIYPRPVKRSVVVPTIFQALSNHMKICLKASVVTDSIVFVREDIPLSIHGGNNVSVGLPEGLSSTALLKSDSKYNIRGCRLRFSNISSSLQISRNGKRDIVLGPRRNRR